jgi:hypothetical protein
VAFDGLGVVWRCWAPGEIDRLAYGAAALAPEGWVTGSAELCATRAPARASVSAMAFPMPRVDPVTSATRPGRVMARPLCPMVDSVMLAPVP